MSLGNKSLFEPSLTDIPNAYGISGTLCVNALMVWFRMLLISYCSALWILRLKPTLHVQYIHIIKMKNICVLFPHINIYLIDTCHMNHSYAMQISSFLLKEDYIICIAHSHNASHEIPPMVCGRVIMHNGLTVCVNTFCWNITDQSTAISPLYFSLRLYIVLCRWITMSGSTIVNDSFKPLTADLVNIWGTHLFVTVPADIVQPSESGDD